MTAKSTPAERADPKAADGPDQAIARVNQSLRGPVIDIFITHVPAFQGMSREAAFDTILSNPKLAEECVKVFRKRPELFKDVLMTADGQHTLDGQLRLVCGRSLDEVMALIVRAVARRYFHNRLTGLRPAKPGTTPAKASRWGRFLGMIHLPAATGSTKPAKRKATRADSLYQALRDFLLYEWQLPLIPHYAPLPVSLVRRLGPRILEFRDAGQLRSLLLEGAAAIPPLPADAEEGRAAANLKHSGVRRTGGRRSPGASSPPPKAEAMWRACQALDLPKVFGIDEAEMRRTVAHVSGVSGHVIGAFAQIGLKLQQTVVILSTIDRDLGHARLSALTGANADPRFVSLMTEHLRNLSVPVMRDPQNIRTATETVLARLGHMAQGPAEKADA